MTTKSSVTVTIRDHLRSAILKGDIPPRTKLRLEQLSTDYGVSLSPVREALLRLMGENLVVGIDQRGFAVAETSVNNLGEVMALRCLLEPFALQRAIERGDLPWEERLVGIFHRLSRIEGTEGRSLALEDWEQAHREFHLALLESCAMPMLMGFCATLYDLSDRYRRLYLARHPPQRDVKHEHSDILQAVIDRDAPKACGLLTDHIRSTGATVLRFMQEHQQTVPPALDS